ncbi:MAG: hypothetical protein K2X86_03175 [Cytophagaceae bacterium]|nr:hypothetical protein [Cytophagaceae bacterium]
MKYKLYLFASLIFLIQGFCHLLIDALPALFLDPDPLQYYPLLDELRLNVFGTSRTMLDFLKGFSQTMGVFMVFYGGMNLILLKTGDEFILSNNYILFLNCILSALLVLLSVLYFHWPPVIFFSFSFVCYLIIVVQNLRKVSP